MSAEITMYRAEEVFKQLEKALELDVANPSVCEYRAAGGQCCIVGHIIGEIDPDELEHLVEVHNTEVFSETSTKEKVPQDLSALLECVQTIADRMTGLEAEDAAKGTWNNIKRLLVASSQSEDALGEVLEELDILDDIPSSALSSIQTGAPLYARLRQDYA